MWRFRNLGHENAAQVSYYGLHSLQHRGQEGAGIVVNNGEKIVGHKGLGLISEVFSRGELEGLNGKSAIGHVRYATAGGSEVANVQPLLFRFSDHSMALAHNGNLINAKMLRRELEAEGSIFQTSSDTEVLLHLIKRSTKDSLIESVKEALNKVKGAFAYLLLTGNEMIVALDPNGFRPLSIGKMGDAYVVASETCAFDVVGATYIRDVEPGELLIINDDGIHVDRLQMM